MSEKVTPKQRRAIEALLTSGDVVSAAKAAGVSRRTLYRWLREPAFRAALHDAEAEALEALSRRLVGLGETAAGVLSEAMTQGETFSVKVRSADIVLSRLLQLRELVDLEARVSELENKLAACRREDFSPNTIGDKIAAI